MLVGLERILLTIRATEDTINSTIISTTIEAVGAFLFLWVNALVNLRSMDLTYRLAAFISRAYAFFGGHKTIRIGTHKVPKGGAVLAINHTSYVDFLYIGVELKRTDRRVIRFMGKIELRKNPILRFIMWGCKIILVDRSLGHDAYVAAVERLRDGELVGVYAEATVSRSFEIKALKTGAARMSLESGAPIIPAIVWGSQRIATKGQPKALGRTRTPVVVAVGPAIRPAGDAETLTRRLHDEMTTLLHQAQEAYGSHPAGEFWVPARMGGGAPTPAEADAMDLAEMDEKDRIRAKMRKKKRH